MTADALECARAFLRDAHMLSPSEAEEALAVAAGVLGTGLARLGDAVRAGDAAGCAELAHALKGNLLNLGLPGLAAVAARVMELAKAGDFDGIAAAADVLAESLGPFWDMRAD